MTRLIYSLMVAFSLLAYKPIYAQEHKPLNIVVTNSILGDWVKNVGGDKIELSVLVGPDGDAHTFEPTPKESIRLANADIVFENGLGFESWLKDLYESSGSKGERIVVTDNMELIRSNEEVDPHVWHSVKNAIEAVHIITKALINKDPSHQDFYQKQSQEYLIQLKSLDEWIRLELKKIPDTHRKLVTSHDTFGYFAKEYGFDIIGAAIDSATTEASDPSAQQMAQLIDKIKASKVPVIFIENVHNPKLMTTVAKEANVRLASPLYTDALGKPDSDGENYIHMMMYNVSIFVKELAL